MLTDDFFLGTKLYRQTLIDLCKPMAKYLGVTESYYINIDKLGRMFNICSNAGWAERFLTEQYYGLDPFMVHPDNMHNGFAFDKASDDQEFSDIVMYDFVVNFNICHSCVYIEKTENGGYFGVSFATTKENHQIVNRFLNESHIIKTFIRNLHKKLMHLIPNFQEQTVDFAALKGDAFYTQQGLVFNEYAKNENKIQLLEEVGMLASPEERKLLMNASLSPQEINCLRIYCSTHSIKQVARDLNLAVSTVTSYISNIKNKLNCNYKNELLEKAAILESLGQI